MVGALLAYFGPAPDSIHLRAAAVRAPWRGAAQTPVVAPGLGFICAQGSALAGVHGGLAIGFQGRIDNLTGLASAFGLDAGDVLHVIAHLYRQQGDEFARHILGDFAIIIIDVNRQSLLAVRDWIGMKPLFWLADGEQVALATEIKQVLALLNLPMHPALKALEAFKADESIDLTATFVEGVHAVPPCGQVRFGLDTAAQVWRRQLRFDPVRLGLNQAAEEIRRRLEIAIARRIPMGVHAGVMLSGGVDSPAVTAVAAHLGQTGKASMLQRCYTMALPEIPECDETGSARHVALSCKLPWTAVEVRVADYRNFPERALEIHDGPVYLTGAGIGLMMDQAQRDGIDTLLTGLGGDEFADQSGDELCQSLLRREWRTAWIWVAAGGRKRLKAHVRITAKAFIDFCKGRRAESMFEDTASWFWTRYTLEILEQEAATRNITVECPLLDFELASFLSGLSPSIKSTPQHTKAALREAVRGLVPDEVRLNPNVMVYNAVAGRVLGQRPEGQSLHRFLNHHFATCWLENVRSASEKKSRYNT